MPAVAQMLITIDEKGQVSVNGPLDQLMLCYGMLEIAKDTIRAHSVEKNKRIQTPGLQDVATFAKKS